MKWGYSFWKSWIPLENVRNNEFKVVMVSGNNEVVLLPSGVFRLNNARTVNYMSLSVRFVNPREAVISSGSSVGFVMCRSSSGEVGKL